MSNPSIAAIKKARVRAKLSQEGAARLIGISTSMWQSCELGRRKMNQEVFDRFVLLSQDKGSGV